MCVYQLRIQETTTTKHQAKTHPVRGQHRVLRAAEPHECTDRSYEIQKLHHGPHPPGVVRVLNLKSKSTSRGAVKRKSEVYPSPVVGVGVGVGVEGDRPSPSQERPSRNERASSSTTATAHTPLTSSGLYADFRAMPPRVRVLVLVLSPPHLHSIVPACKQLGTCRLHRTPLVDRWINVAEILGANCSASDHHVNASFPAISRPADELSCGSESSAADCLEGRGDDAQ